MDVQISQTALNGLREGFAGQILVPGDSIYSEAGGLYNTMIEARPAVIAQCADVQDVVRAVNFGRDLGLEIAVRGGAHSVVGYATADGGLVIDLRRMNAVSVDPEARTAPVAGGATAAELDRATGQHGLATTGARGSTVGVAGFTLGGGNGWLDRKFGLACDNLVSAELVMADGSVIRASDDENPDLFWGLHGGGGNFGVVTSLTLQLHELPSTTAVLLLWAPQAAPDVLRAYRDFMESASDEVGGGALYLTAPDLEFVQKHRVGKLTLAVLVVYAGTETEARKATAAMLELRHEGELIAEMPYADIQCMFDDPPDYRNYWSATSLKAMLDEAIDLICAEARDMLVPSASVNLIFPQGGAVARGRADYPVPWRHAPWVVHPFCQWRDPSDDERVRRWVLDIPAKLKPWSIDPVSLNYVGDVGEDRIRASFGQENYVKLAKLKAHYDPKNVFHRNHNIRPNNVAG
jgi:FAD/FMN-containing dehydrogenase